MYNAYLTLVTQKTCMKNPPLTLTRLRDDPEPLLTTLKPLLTTLSLSGSLQRDQHVFQRAQETQYTPKELLTRNNVVLTMNIFGPFQMNKTFTTSLHGIVMQ